jgi:enoyl-CoA hydratase/carnithine racemase
MSRMREMMMTGRTYSAEEGQALGLSHYLVACGDGLKKGIELARRAAQNAPLTNFALINALPRIVEANSESGFLMEALMSSIASSDPEAQARLEAFFQKRAPKATPTP